MKLSILIFTIAAFYANIAFGLAQAGRTRYRVLPGSKVCKPQSPLCCSAVRGCRIRYQAGGRWQTKQDRTATKLACTQVCGTHFRKCVDLCNCVTSQTEVGNLKPCKCKLNVPHNIVRFSCIKRCVSARNQCVNNCHTEKCPLSADTRMIWDKEFDGKCDAICPPKDHLSTVCPLAGGQYGKVDEDA